jgi:tetratricopeptide (TPR) repeat protein
MAWSYDLLDPVEQRLFRRLSVFADGCSYEAAEEIAGADADTLQALLDKSLLGRREVVGGPRFWMLETIREYAAERLGTADEVEELRLRHLDHYRAVADACYDETWSGRTDLAQLIEERENLRGALDVALETDPESALVLATQLAVLWLDHGGIGEGREKLEDALARAPSRPTASRALALLSSGTLASAQWDFAVADERCLEALRLFRALRDPRGEGRALLWLGFSAWRRGELGEARCRTEEALRSFEIAGDETWRRRGVSNLALILSALGDHARALEIQREVVQLARRDESAFTLAVFLNHLGELERLAGEQERARCSLEESVGLMRHAGQTRFLGATLASLGDLLRTDAPTDALAALSEALEIARDTDSYHLAAACFEGAAGIFAAGRDPEHAASLLGAAATIRASLGSNPQEQADADAAAAQCRAALTLEEFARAWERGAALDAHAAAESALRTWKSLS